MLHDLREIPVIDPFATLLALNEMLGLVFRGNPESGSKISREVTHGAIVLWGMGGKCDSGPTHQGYPPSAGSCCGSARPSSLPLNLALDFPLLRLISNYLFLVTRARCARAGHDSASKRRYPGRKDPRLNKAPGLITLAPAPIGQVRATG
jgi:hypothetical protein